MRVTADGIKPCSRCYEARQKVKDALGALAGKKVDPYTMFECDGGVAIVDAQRIIVATSQGFSGYVGRKVYQAGAWLVDVGAAHRLQVFGKVRAAKPLETLDDWVAGA